ncbi:MAG: AzlD domain-containing protein [Actinomycetota bacterium]
MTEAWTIVALVGLGTVVIKSLGPMLLGGKPLPRQIGALVALLAPALLAALVAINTFGEGRNLTADARVLGVAVAAVATLRKAPVLLVIVLAAGTTALARALGA